MESVPFSVFEGYLKCMRADNLSPAQKDWLNVLFPRFFDAPPENFPKSAYPADRGGDGFEQPFAFRRFAGGPDLPRGRYFSVCTGSEGTDRGTMAAEVAAYCDPERAGEVHVVDLSDPDFAEARKHMRPDDSALLNGIYCAFQTRANVPVGRSGALLHALNASGSTTGAGGLFLHTVTVNTTIDKCIDLRLPATQNWLNTQVRAGLPGVFYTYGEQPEMLLHKLVTDSTWADRAMTRDEFLAAVDDLRSQGRHRAYTTPCQRPFTRLEMPDTFAGLLPLFLFPRQGG